MQNQIELTNFNIKGILIFMTEYNTEMVETFLLTQEIYFDHMNIEKI
jgi:hypothetical protein